jgi:hypothetical protein
MMLKGSSSSVSGNLFSLVLTFHVVFNLFDKLFFIPEQQYLIFSIKGREKLTAVAELKTTHAGKLERPGIYEKEQGIKNRLFGMLRMPLECIK